MVKSSYQSNVQGRSNLRAKTKVLGSQNLHRNREPYFTLVQKICSEGPMISRLIQMVKYDTNYLWRPFGAIPDIVGQFKSHFYL